MEVGKNRSLDGIFLSKFTGQRWCIAIRVLVGVRLSCLSTHFSKSVSKFMLFSDL